MDLLSVLPGETEVLVGLNDEVSPGVVRFADEEHYSYVVMPMRL
jgi:DNA polymerase III sliding clamp (beta) subunit (PCNA family)